MSSSHRVVTIYGATGNQGGSVARSLVDNKSHQFSVRGISRNPESDASKNLTALGVEVVKADGWDAASLQKAFEGSWGAFVNLNSDDPIFRGESAKSEFDLGKTIFDNAAKAGVKHIVFSSGPPCTELTGGKVSMKAMDMKWKIETYVRKELSFETATFINAGWFMQNFAFREAAPIFGGFPFNPDEDGYLTYKVPKWGGEENVPWLSITRDFGDIVQGIFLDPVRWNGTLVHGASQLGSFDDMTAAFQKVTGKKARYDPVMPTWEAFDTHGVEELEDVKLMFGFAQCTGGRYMGPEPTETKTSAELKKNAAEARGKSGQDLKLETLEGFFSTFQV